MHFSVKIYLNRNSVWSKQGTSLRCRHWINRQICCFFFNIHQLRSIHRLITIESLQAMVKALVPTHLNYCNGLLDGAPKCLLSQLSEVLRAAAHLILLLPCISSVVNDIPAMMQGLDIPVTFTFKWANLLINDRDTINTNDNEQTKQNNFNGTLNEWICV